MSDNKDLDEALAALVFLLDQSRASHNYRGCRLPNELVNMTSAAEFKAQKVIDKYPWVRIALVNGEIR
jgi:hypothetical protein